MGTVMRKDEEKTRGELLAEIGELRQQLANTELALFSFQQQCEARNRELAQECAEHRDAARALEMAQLIVEKSPVILFRRVAGDDPRLEYISENLRQFGYAPDELLSGNIYFRDLVHPDDMERVRQEILDYAEADVEEYTMFYRCITKDGDVRWIEDQTSVIRDGDGKKTHNQGILFDITERKLAEDALRKSEEKYRRIVETTGEGFVLMNEDLVIVDVNEAYCRWTGYAREELIGTTALQLMAPEFREYMQANQTRFLAQEYRTFEGEAINKDGRRTPFLIHGNTLRGDQGKVIGHMAFITDMTEHKKALKLAGEVQKSLLPQERPQVRGLDIAGRNVSCEEIGGDYFDFIWQRDSRNGPFQVVVGDISGHGVDSALLMTSARACLRMRALQPGTIGEIVSALNRELARDVLDSGRFMTLFYLSIDPVTRSLGWVRAGHEPALLYDPAVDTFLEMKGEGIALGIMDDVAYQEYRHEHLVDGQIIAIGTDGVWEAFNSRGEMFGKARLRECIRRNSARSATAILAAVYDELKRCTLGCRTEDDITLVIVKIDGLDAM